jgi:poly(3-hydroxyalkanoate) synthetase
MNGSSRASTPSPDRARQALDRDTSGSMWDALAASLAATAQAGELALRTFADVLSQAASEAEPEGPEPLWATPHQIVTETATFRVRDFSTGRGTPPILVVAPFALHGATVADFAPGHSLVERLLAEGLERLLLVEWKSATAATRSLTIDNYLADLAVIIDDCGGRVTLIGLCQGGWLSLMAAARFPQKVDRLVLAGSPVDLDAAPSKFVDAVRAASPATFEALVRAGNGLIIGQRMLSAWGAGALDAPGQAHTLQTDGPVPHELSERFQKWDRWAVNLPGPYYLQVVEQLFRGNQLAKSQFCALGRVLDLSAVKAPIYLLAGQDDEVSPPEQVLALSRLVGTPPQSIRWAVTPCSHLALFMGAHTLTTAWPNVCAWLLEHSSDEGRRRACERVGVGSGRSDRLDTTAPSPPL